MSIIFHQFLFGRLGYPFVLLWERLSCRKSETHTVHSHYISNVFNVAKYKNVLYFKGADMLDGTPLLDIKPYIPEFDVFPVEKTGWYQHRKHAWSLEVSTGYIFIRPDTINKEVHGFM